jgi:NTE family protein
VRRARLASPYFSRIDLAAELYDETVFERKTFAALAARRRPFVILHATNMATGAAFEFTQNEFALNLSRYYRARHRLDLSSGPHVDSKWVHLVDGGLADNIGLRSILRAWDRGFIQQRVNARPHQAARRDHRERTHGPAGRARPPRALARRRQRGPEDRSR